MFTTSQRVAVKTSFTYDHKTDRYMCNDGTTYTSDEIDALDEMESVWRDSTPRYSFYEWVAIFEDKKPAILKSIRAHVKDIKEYLMVLQDTFELDKGLLQDAYTRTPNPLTFQKIKADIEKAERVLEAESEGFRKEMAILNSRIIYLTGKVNVGAISDHNIGRAKEYPITTLIKVGRGNKALCPFHHDTNPSLHVYKDNHAYCFVCQKSASSIDIYMALHSCDFKTAVRALAV